MSIISSSAGLSVDPSKVQKIGIDPSSIRQLTEKQKAEFERIRQMQYTTIVNLGDLKNHVSQQVYAEVKVDGKTIATVYNGGTSSTSNAYGGRIDKIIEGLDSKLTGPDAAQERADAIAKALGGTVVKSDTAVTQAEYISAAPFKPEYKLDYEAMERDRRAVEGRVATPQTQVTAQSYGSAGDMHDTIDNKAVGQSAVDKFLSFTEKSWQEKVRAMILSSLGVTEEQLQGMSAEDREKIEAKIKEKIQQEIEKKTGIAGQSTAAVEGATGTDMAAV